MPQLIAMIIVVVGAMIYMFQTFGGTGDKIEGVAQKGSIITEINNIKDGIKIAARSEQIAATASGDKVNNLKGLGNLSYFAEQINQQLKDNSTDNANKYFAISFGGTENDTNPAMILSLVTVQNKTPGIYVEFPANGSLGKNASFLETQIANDLKSIAHIDRGAESTTAGSIAWQETQTTVEDRMPGKTAITDAKLTDGKFIIYFDDFGSNEVVK